VSITPDCSFVHTKKRFEPPVEAAKPKSLILDPISILQSCRTFKPKEIYRPLLQREEPQIQDSEGHNRSSFPVVVS
jgi:hypothetical protein